MVVLLPFGNVPYSLPKLTLGVFQEVPLLDLRSDKHGIEGERLQ
jgi:hypothetical protein